MIQGSTEVLTGTVYALAMAESGLIASIDGAVDPRLVALAEVVPELLASTESTPLDGLWARLGCASRDSFFRELYFVSRSHVHVVVPLPSRPGTVLLSVSPLPGSVGIVLSAVRAKVLELEASGALT